MSTLEATVTQDVPELLDGIGRASPGPLFLIDEIGRSHPLNDRARALRPGDAGSEAFVSPVVAGEREGARIVGFVEAAAEPASAALVSALVALAAAVARRALEESAPQPSQRPISERRRGILSRACRELGELADEADVGRVLVRAASEMLRARSAALFVPRDGGERLEPVACAGVAERELGPVRPGRGLLGFAATRSEPTVLTGYHRLPSSLGTSESHHAMASWYDLPLAAIPLRNGPDLSGLLCVSGLPGRRRESDVHGELGRLERLTEKAAANLAGVRLTRQVRRAERVQRELEIARQIQSCLLPAGEHETAGLQLAGDCRPAAQVGGDWFGHREGRDGSLSVGMFDVAGHGIGAAFCMTMVRSVLHGRLDGPGTPAEVLEGANTLAWEDLGGSGLYATAFLARFRPDRGTVEYACAGHPPPVHWSAERRSFVDHREGGLPLGLVGEVSHRCASAPFGEGDVFVLYTDGIVEARDRRGEPFGRHRLLAAVRRLRRRSARVILRGVWRELEAFIGDRALDDDATLTVVKGVADVETGGRERSARAKGRAAEPLASPASRVQAALGEEATSCDAPGQDVRTACRSVPETAADTRGGAVRGAGARADAGIASDAALPEDGRPAACATTQGASATTRDATATSRDPATRDATLTMQDATPTMQEGTPTTGDASVTTPDATTRDATTKTTTDTEAETAP